MSTAERPSLDDGKNNSRADETTESGENGQSERYDCREIYRNMRMESQDGEVAPFRCGSWSCYCCAHRMRMNLIESLEDLVDRRPEMRRLLTLTIGRKGPEGAEKQHEYITDRFNALRTELNDRYTDLSYVWIRHEGDENGRAHLHLLVDRYLPQDELSHLAARVGLGRVVDIRRVNARNAAKYLTSYLGKGAMANLPKGLRRYGSSGDIQLQVRGSGGESDKEWYLVMDDWVFQRLDGGQPGTRSVARVDFVHQREWGGPIPPPLQDGRITPEKWLQVRGC